MEIIAHRGNKSGTPENTLAAFRSAIEAGADGVELDVQLTRDKEVLVVHDEFLGRTLPGEGRVVDHTLAELQALDAGGWFGPDYAGERAPALEEALHLLRPESVTLCVEMKTGRYPYPGLAQRVVALISEFGMEERTLYASFNHDTLRQIKNVAPDAQCAALVNMRLLEPWEYLTRHGFQAVHVERHACAREDIEQCHARGMAMRAWTVNDERAARPLFEMGVDGVITDEPEAMRKWFQAWREAPKK